MSLQPHQQRVVDEQRELDDKISKLRAFIASPVFLSIASAEQERLSDQLDVMQIYSDILGARIAAF